MFLSRIRLNTSLRKTQLAMASPNIFHGAIERAFDVKQVRNLWRIDKLMGQYFLLIVSKEKPNLDIIIDQFGYVGEKGETKEYDNFINRICENQQWRFRLVANPTRTLRREGKRGKIVAHTSPKFQLAWLENKAIQNGFKLYDAYVLENRWKIFKKNSEQSKVKVKEVVFEGILSVDNVELFRKALIEGIGRGKVYGMGMLTIVSV